MAPTVHATTQLAPARDADATRAAILDAARHAFAADGFHGTSMSRLAKDAGVTQSLIHHHFGAKRDLWNYLKVWYATGYLAAFPRGSIDPNDPIGDWTRRFAALLAAYPELVRLVAWAELDRDTEFPEPLLDAVASLHATFADAQEQGWIRADVDARSAGFVVVQAAMGWILAGGQRDAVGPDLTDDRYLDDIVKILRSGLAPGAADPSAPQLPPRGGSR